MGSLLQPFLLLLIGESPGHGYELIDRLESLGVPGVEPGQVYRALRCLEREGAVVSAWVTSSRGPARRHYELTPEGTARMDAWAARLRDLHQVLGACLSRWPDGPSRSRRAERPAPGQAAPPGGRARPVRAPGRRAPAGAAAALASARSAAHAAAPGVP